jgi:hypothetical protein
MPETPEAIRGLADTMITRFTPPSFVPGCEVKSIADIDEYTTNNGWIEAIVGGDNQQRVRYYGTPQGVAVNDFVDVEYFPAYKLYRVFGSTLGGTASVGGVRVNEVWEKDFGNVAVYTDNGGNVGIGTASPTDDLQVEGASGITAIASVFTGGQFVELRAGSTGSSFGYSDGGAFQIGMVDALNKGSLDTVVMRLNTSADVGIGLSSGIAAQLHIDQSSTTGAQPVLKLDQGDASEQCIMYSGDGADQDVILDTVEVTGTPTRFWDESEDAFSWNKGLRVTSGRVAIGNVSPDTPLHVYTGNASTTANALTLIAAEHSGAAAISVLTGNTSSGFLMFGDSGDSFIGGIRYFHNDDSMRFQVNNTEHMIIDSSGNIGIGTTAPDWQLHVEADSQVRIVAENTETDGNVWFSLKNDAADWLFGNRGDTSDIFEIHDNSVGGADNVFTAQKTTGNIGIGTTSPDTRLDIDAGAMEFAEMTAPSAGAANTARLFTQDNGAGKTQLAVRFNTGAIQILATEP